MTSTDDYNSAARGLRQAPPHSARGVLDLRELVRCATLAASSHNTQPWKFRAQHDTITVLPDYSRRCPVVDPDDSHLFKSLGCAAENIVQAAAAQGFAADVRFDSPQDAVVIRLSSDPLAHASDLHAAIGRRQCAKTAYDGVALAQADLGLLKEAGIGQDVSVIMLVSPDQLETVVEYVTRGNHAQLTDPSFRDELVSWIRFNPADALRTGDGLAGITSGHPALPTWVGKRMAGVLLTAKGQAQLDADRIRGSAGVAVFVSRQDDKAAWVEVGRAYERFALQATALDVRTAFINQPIEVRELRAPFEDLLGLQGKHAQLMVRFGRGPQAPFSVRRPIDEVIVE